MNTNTNNTNPNAPALLASYTPGQIEFIKFLQSNRAALTIYDGCVVSRVDLVATIEHGAYIAVPAWIAAAKDRRAGRGNYYIPEIWVDVATLTVNNNKRGRKAGSRNQKGRVTTAAPVPSPTTATTATA